MPKWPWKRTRKQREAQAKELGLPIPIMNLPEGYTTGGPGKYMNFQEAYRAGAVAAWHESAYLHLRKVSESR